ncbi:hypothetical protein A0U92_16480 [Acetobacter aceti]|uniref:Uncharacterized protein n=1 Tax=Acetobacter aceti TaxID=435 RepID=A0A1U9KJV9_ACEAC|nr:hypothetical protein A0U92_16480 [Acetobacter aceti]
MSETGHLVTVKALGEAFFKKLHGISYCLKIKISIKTSELFERNFMRDFSGQTSWNECFVLS